MPLGNEEQTMLREMAHNWAQRNAPVGEFRAMRDADNERGFDANTFAAVAEMGWTGAVIDEDYGGSNVGFVGMGAVLEELGRTLVAVPLIGSAVGTATAIGLGGTEQQKSLWLPRIAAGEVIGALAIDESARHAPRRMSCGASKDGTGYILSGTKTLVHEGMAAGIFVVATRTSGAVSDAHGVTLFLVPGDAPGIERARRQVMDSRGYADVTFNAVKVGADAVLGQVDDGSVLLDAVLDRTTAAVAAEEFGLALQAFDTTLEYLKTRVQFGQPIGAFQALQHRAAKMFTDIALARPCLEAALFALDENAADAPKLVSLAKAVVNELANHISREMIQLHGGIGMTDAHDAGFYIKRARVLEAAFGTSAYHRDRYGRLSGV